MLKSLHLWVPPLFRIPNIGLRRLTSLALILGVFGCADTAPRDVPLGNNSEAAAHSSARLYVLDCGSIKLDSVVPFGLSDDAGTDVAGSAVFQASPGSN